MRRVGGLIPKVHSFPNLLLAFKRASKGKKSRSAVARFAMDLEPELLKLQKELLEGTWKPGAYGCFTIRDPKERSISVAPFRDRVVHHAIINVLTPYFEARFDFDSYGCRKGKGTDKALERAVHFSKRYPFCLKMDIQKFFASVDHERLKRLLRRIIKDQGLLLLLDRIIDSAKEGLPLGNLTSQWMANFYLTPYDRFLRSRSGVNGLIRYMDDVLVFGKGKAQLKSLLPKARDYLKDELNLVLKEAQTHIYPTLAGVPFLGFRVFPGTLGVRQETFRRLKRRMKHREWEYRMGYISLDKLAESAGSMIAHLNRAPSGGVRERYFTDAKPMEW